MGIVLRDIRIRVPAIIAAIIAVAVIVIVVAAVTGDIIVAGIAIGVAGRGDSGAAAAGRDRDSAAVEVCGFVCGMS